MSDSRRAIAEKYHKHAVVWGQIDYKLWSDIRGLRSWGTIAPNDVMISLKETLALLEAAAEKRFEDEWKARQQGDPR